MQRYISLILDYKSLLFCGPNGTSKSYIARKIAEYLARRHHKDPDTSIAYFNVENKSSKDLKLYLNNIVEQSNLSSSSSSSSSCSSSSSSTDSELPHVLILDNLHNISNISDAFGEYFLSPKKCAYVIGTINQSNVASLNLHQSFKWILCLNHTEPVKSFLNRYLNRRLIDHEVKKQERNPDLELIINWMPQLWAHVNKYVELYNSIDLTLGPKLFATFPMDLHQAQHWFAELWNNSLVPFLVDTIKEGLEVYGTKSVWENPRVWIAKTLPWLLYDEDALNSLYSIDEQNFAEFFSASTPTELHLLNNCNENEDDEEEAQYHTNQEPLPKNQSTLRLHAFQHNGSARSSLNRCSNENDKLLNMLMRLQETTLNQKYSVASQVGNSVDLMAANDQQEANFLKMQKSIESII